LELASRSETYARRVSPLSVLRSRFTVGMAPVLRASTTDTVGGCFRPPESNLSASLTLLQSLTRPSLAACTAARDASHELLCPSAHSDRRVHYGRALPSRRFRLQGLATLLTVFSSAALANRVSDRQRSWASPFEAFSSRRASRHSCRADPHAVSYPSLIPPEGRCRLEPHRLLGFAPAESAWRRGQTVKSTGRWLLPWALPF
jgi:hypothetical protein